jgi:D-lactate dehydrogenase
MRMILFSSRQYDSDTFAEANGTHRYELHFQESHLDVETAVLARGYEVVCPFVNDNVDAAVLERLHAGGTRMIALRSAGFNHVDLLRPSASA